jgi:dienelactone hydrolase
VARIGLLLVVAALLAGCGSDEREAGPFAYDEDQPLAVEQVSESEPQGRVVVRDLSYASGDDRVEALLVSPAVKGEARPAVVFLHGAGGDRTEQAVSAVKLAKRGITALTLTVPSRTKTQPAGLTTEEALRWERDKIVDDVIAVRRALDVLGDDDAVDDERLGLVGWSMGARLATIVADVDDRVRATVLESAGAVPVSEYVDAAPFELRDDVQEVLPAIDPLSHVASVRAPLLVQAGRQDEVVPERALQHVAEAAPEGTEVRWYSAGHALDARAERERLDWIARQLER